MSWSFRAKGMTQAVLDAVMASVQNDPPLDEPEQRIRSLCGDIVSKAANVMPENCGLVVEAHGSMSVTDSGKLLSCGFSMETMSAREVAQHEQKEKQEVERKARDEAEQRQRAEQRKSNDTGKTAGQEVK